MNMRSYLKIIVAVVSLLACWSCSDDSEPTGGLEGSWYGTRVHYNPASGSKYQYLTVRFESDGSGSSEYEGPTVYGVAKFAYKVKGGVVQCRGVYASSSGESDEEFEMDLRMEGDRLIPLNKYTQFILTRDNSVLTDGNGNEIVDQSEQLQQVWLDKEGHTVMEIYDDKKFIEYTLSAPFAKTYSYIREGTYWYDAARKLINFQGYQWEILSLSSLEMSLKRDGRIVKYKAGKDSDIPKPKL